VKGDDATRPENLTMKGGRVIRKDIAVYVFFLLLAFVLWYLNSLGKEMEAGIKYQVKFTNLPRERAVNKEQPSELNLFLKGPGYSILKLKVSGNKAPLIIDISKVNYRRSPGDKTLDYYIITSGLTKSLNIQMRSGCEITSIKPDTLFFTLVKATKTSFVTEGNHDSRKSN
jgi:hypothetical protein